MTRDLYAVEIWGPRQLESRADDLVKRICRLWARPQIAD
jgi:hypothetical protein